LRNTENKRNHIGITKVEILLALNGSSVPIAVIYHQQRSNFVRLHAIVM
jgi:hypothetical protein